MKKYPVYYCYIKKTLRMMDPLFFGVLCHKVCDKYYKRDDKVLKNKTTKHKGCMFLFYRPYTNLVGHNMRCKLLTKECSICLEALARGREKASKWGINDCAHSGCWDYVDWATELCRNHKKEK